MLFRDNMENEMNVTMVLNVQVEQVAGTRKKTKSNYMEEDI